jgi:hypothetical protein
MLDRDVMNRVSTIQFIYAMLCPMRFAKYLCSSKPDLFIYFLLQKGIIPYLYILIKAYKLEDIIP